MGAILLHVILVLTVGFLPGLSEDSIKVQLTVEPLGSRVFAGKPVSLRCVVDGASSLGWIYNWSQPINPRHQAAGDRYTITTMTAADQGPYWCTVRKNGTDEKLWHSNTITLNVSDGSMVIHGPAHPVSEGENFKLRCVYRWHPSNTTTFYKDGLMMVTQKSTEMTIWNATKVNEGFYKCVNHITQEESSETWVSVTGTSTRGVNAEEEKPTLEENPTVFSEDSWVWVVVLCCIAGLLLLVPALGILVYRCWSRSDTSMLSRFQEVQPRQRTPQTKPDMTEVQWDMAWMEMTNLLEKQDQSVAPDSSLTS